MSPKNTLEGLDPVDMSQIQQISPSPIFEELRLSIMAGRTDPQEPEWEPEALSSGHPAPRRSRSVPALIVVGVVALVAAALLAYSAVGVSPKHAAATKKHTAATTWPPAVRPARGSGRAHAGTVRTGTWELADFLSGTWQQNVTGGPPPGYLSCPTTSACYAMSGQYASPRAGSPLLSETLYLSTDDGATWTSLPMPQGFDPTSPLACGGASSCAAGGTYNGQPVLVTTSNGGTSFAIHPLPSGVGHLDTLSCPSTRYCAGLAAPSELLDLGTTNATFLSTTDGGGHFHDGNILTGDSMDALTCSSSHDCTTVGWSNALGPNDWTAGVVAKTTDGGRTWRPGTLPVGFGIDGSRLSCADADHCSVTGMISIKTTDPPQCRSIPLPSSPATTMPSAQSPAVRAIARAESLAAKDAGLKAAASSSGGFSCSSGQGSVSDVASTANGGLSWTPDPLPVDVPQPVLADLSCPTVKQCWASGSDAEPERIGIDDSGGSSVLLGTTDGGLTWSKVTFNVPPGAPNYYGDSYLSMGSIACPSTGHCVALGIGAQSSPSVPTYSLSAPKPTERR
jgi:hypothetical protein